MILGCKSKASERHDIHCRVEYTAAHAPPKENRCVHCLLHLVLSFATCDPRLQDGSDLAMVCKSRVQVLDKSDALNSEMVVKAGVCTAYVQGVIDTFDVLRWGKTLPGSFLFS